MHNSKLYLIFVFSLALSACNSTYLSKHKMPTLLDAEFPTSTEVKIESAEDIFAIDEEMIAFVEESTRGNITNQAKITALANAIFDRNALSVVYSESANTTARETFKRGAANCLSLTIMTYSMAEHLGMRSAFQDVAIPEFWTRREGNTLINRHINLAVKEHIINRQLLTSPPIVVDFDPQQGMRQFTSNELNKSEIVSLFYANKGADYIINGNPGFAYAYLKAAVLEDPNNEGAWSNLGVLFSQQGRLEKAEEFYAMALFVKPDFASAYENLAFLYERQGKPSKSTQLLKRLHKQRQKNPYYHKVLGDIAAESLDYTNAIEHYKRAILLNHKPHEFHFSLAKIYFAQGDIENAQRYLKNAKKRASTKDLGERYASKLSSLIASR